MTIAGRTSARTAWAVMLVVVLMLVQEPTMVAGSVKLALGNGRFSQCQTLWAKQAIAVGSVCVDADQANPDQLIVAYATMDGWKLDQAHLWFGRNVSQLPLLRDQEEEGEDADGRQTQQQQATTRTKKNQRQDRADLTQFPFQKEDLEGKHAHYGFLVKLDDLDFTCPNSQGTDFFAAAHAIVTARPSLRNGNQATQQSAWASPVAPNTVTLHDAQGNPTITGFKEWMDFNFTLVCDIRNDPPKDAPMRHFANKLPQ